MTGGGPATKRWTTKFRAMSVAVTVFAFGLTGQARAEPPAPAGAGRWEGELVQQGRAVAIRYDLAAELEAST